MNVQIERIHKRSISNPSSHFKAKIWAKIFKKPQHHQYLKYISIEKEVFKVDFIINRNQKDVLKL